LEIHKKKLDKAKELLDKMGTTASACDIIVSLEIKDFIQEIEVPKKRLKVNESNEKAIKVAA
jgi:hypothetical protein